jgi:signal transduction histidine kinase/DNA-binding LacI/PurR family transcriptional regulator/CheY-like chemotaxis protein
MKSRASPPPERAPTIAVLVELLEGEYQSAVVGGLVEAAREWGFNVLILADNLRQTTIGGEARRGLTHDLAGTDGVDAVAVMAGPLANQIGMEELEGYCRRFRPRPMCSIAAALDGMTGIFVDGAPALRDGLRHLAAEHHYRNIAFLGGPPGNVEADERLDTYRTALAEVGLPAPDSHVVSGDFRYEAGVEGVRILMDERGLAPDAIVATSDTIALGAIDALRIRGLQVPRDVAVTGFDDVSDARYSVPPLTTIRQPLRQVGRVAADVLLRRLRGENVEDAIVLPAELILRRSCGCYPERRRTVTTTGRPAAAAGASGGVDPDEALRLGREAILKSVRGAAGGAEDGLPDGWAEGLLDALVADLKGTPPAFLDGVAGLLKETVGPAATEHPLQQALIAMEREVPACLAADTAVGARAGELLQEARRLVGESIEDSHVHYRLMIERRRRSLSEATEALSAGFDLSSLAEAMHESLPRLGVPSAYLVLDGAASAGGARVAFAHDPLRGAVDLDRLMAVEVRDGSLPDGLLPCDRACALVVEPLFFKDDPLGYAVFEMAPRDSFTYDAFGALRVRISGAVKVALLIEELQMSAGQLRQAQKMETLGQLSGAIAHDFNNLLQAIRGYAELAAMAEPGGAEAAADLEEIVRASDRAAQLTRQLLSFSQPTRANARPVDVNACVEQTLPLIKRLMGPTVEVSAVLGPEAGSIVIDPAQLEQAIVNLCVNSRDAMPDGGSVTIETGRRVPGPGASSGLTAPGVRGRVASTPMTFVCVGDSGVGIPSEIRDRVFEPFFTTKGAGQGTGLGLSIVYGIVRGASGQIEVESETGRGTRVWLMFPPSGSGQEAAALATEPPELGNETVLLVEDVDAIRRLAQRVLTDGGYRVLSAADALEARDLWAANEGRVDLLLSDVTMPGPSGVAFAAELERSAKPPRVLFISGRPPGRPGGPELPKGASFLSKPFSVSGLLEAVRAALDSSPNE